jgi:hypothetical protein
MVNVILLHYPSPKWRVRATVERCPNHNEERASEDERLTLDLSLQEMILLTVLLFYNEARMYQARGSQS